jgi:fructose-bisphosphate aldolase class II/tagatose 1,6-diphosphate aldolase GatY/KbaY
MTLREKLAEVRNKQQALLAVNFYNFETLQGIAQAAAELGQPLILQLTRASLEYMGLEVAVNMARTIIASFGLQAWLHLDHGDSPELARQCLDAGFDSVMIDASDKPMDENIRLTQEVVEIARRQQAVVEAELGYVARLGQDQDRQYFTDPEDARRFVVETGVDALAVAIGTAHGFYKTEPRLDFDRLQAIRRATDAFLVLHGASGLPEEAVSIAVQNGICKVNVATETKNTFMKTVQGHICGNPEIDLRKVFPPAIDAVRRLIINKLNIVSTN